MVAPSVCCGQSWGGQASVLVLIDEIVVWRAGLDDLLARFAHRFGRAEPRRQALSYLVGLLSPLASKNGWTLAEAAGDTTPDRMQRLPNKSAWDPDAVRDDLCETAPTRIFWVLRCWRVHRGRGYARVSG
ncbi:transposase [Micromonospora sp. NPDC050795]|uniref:transposase n=1 Tax=Micromonospora sp. NPDC050795 TaxID=3364282 RepID=UPI0037B4E393